MDPIRLSPSDFAFLWEQCRRCFWLKTVHGIRQPSMPMAAIFKRLESLQMRLYEGVRTTDVLPGLPPGERVTVSIGVGVFTKGEMSDCETLIRLADTALYDAKRQGKNRVIIGQP